MPAPDDGATLARRAFLSTLAGGLVAARAARAQPAGKVYRLGWLTTSRHPFIANFREGMTELGHVEGQSYLLLERYAGRAERLPELMAELLRQDLDVLVTSGSAASITARSASVPVVFVTGDPLGDGVVASLSQPGGGMTGLALLNTEFGAKWMELLREALPRLNRVAVLRDPAAAPRQVESAVTAARALRLDVSVVDAAAPEAIEPAFQRMIGERAGAVVQLSSPMFAANKQKIVRLAARHRLPVIYEHRDFVEAGGLVSYGPDLRDVFRRAAGMVHKVLRGARPADLPVEQPTRIELVVNLRTARALNLTLPQAFLLRADQVIE